MVASFSRWIDNFFHACDDPRSGRPTRANRTQQYYGLLNKPFTLIALVHFLYTKITRRFKNNLSSRSFSGYKTYSLYVYKIYTRRFFSFVEMLSSHLLTGTGVKNTTRFALLSLGVAVRVLIWVKFNSSLGICNASCNTRKVIICRSVLLRVTYDCACYSRT